jgi:hypothetical protein
MNSQPSLKIIKGKRVSLLIPETLLPGTGSSETLVNIPDDTNHHVLTELHDLYMLRGILGQRNLGSNSGLSTRVGWR